MGPGQYHRCNVGIMAKEWKYFSELTEWKVVSPARTVPKTSSNAENEDRHSVLIFEKPLPEETTVKLTLDRCVECIYFIREVLIYTQ